MIFLMCLIYMDAVVRDVNDRPVLGRILALQHDGCDK